MSKGKCGDCKHRLPKRICGSTDSPYFNRQIELTDSCQSFLENPAQEHNTKAFALSFNDDHAGAIQEIRVALDLGLPTDDEVPARALLGSTLFELFDATSEQASEGIAELEKALSLDADGQYAFFLEALNRGAYLYKLQLTYSLRARSLRKAEGIDTAIKYLENKLRLFEYIPGSHMVVLNSDLGNLYHEKSQQDAARTYWRRAMDSEVLSSESDFELKTKEMAKHNLSLLQPQSSPKSGCFIATHAYGGYHCEEVKILQRYRDEVLVKAGVGKILVMLYYRISPRLVRMVGASNVVKRFVKAAVIAPFVTYVRRRLQLKREDEKC